MKEKAKKTLTVGLGANIGNLNILLSSIAPNCHELGYAKATGKSASPPAWLLAQGAPAEVDGSKDAHSSEWMEKIPSIGPAVWMDCFPGCWLGHHGAHFVPTREPHIAKFCVADEGY